MTIANPYPEVGSRIAQARGALTQAEFAARIGVDRKTVVRWEQGERLPDGASLLAMWREFHVDAGWLIAGAGSAPELSARERFLLGQYRAATAQGRLALETVGAAVIEQLQAPEPPPYVTTGGKPTRLELYDAAAAPLAKRKPPKP